MKNKAKWCVEAKYSTREERSKFYKEIGEDPKEYDIDDFNEVEISVVREDNKHGIRSYGWDDMDKIILFDDGDYTEDEIEWCKKVAGIIRDALNRNSL